MSMTTDEKRAALEAAGYRVSGKDLVYKDDITYDTTYNDTGLSAIEQAYAHWQEQQTVATFVKAVWEVGSQSRNYNARVAQLATVFAIDYRNRHGMIDDLTHEDVADLRHNRLDSLYDDDESSETDE